MVELSKEGNGGGKETGPGTKEIGGHEPWGWGRQQIVEMSTDGTALFYGRVLFWVFWDELNLAFYTFWQLPSGSAQYFLILGWETTEMAPSGE